MYEEEEESMESVSSNELEGSQVRDIESFNSDE